MEKYSNKETGRRMFSGWFTVVPIAMLLLFFWGLLVVFDVNLDYDSAKIFVIWLPILFIIYWLAFKYYDKNNP
jgi:hypothetical protein